VTHGHRAIGVGCDVGDEDQVIAAMARTVDELGQVDSLIANAGIGGFSPFIHMSLEEWRRVQRVNLDGVFLCLREATRHLVERGEGGSLVAVSSVSAIHGAPGMEHYASAKAGVLALVRSLAVELARHRIRVNAVVPGWTESEMLDPGTANPKFVEATTKRTPVRRWGTPDDLGRAVAYLADPTNLFHTGDALVVDGGYSIF
jgi:NAD(P)-dependent dehydrogenase (short-subunit alcohol dehydrogenase family)